MKRKTFTPDMVTNEMLSAAKDELLETDHVGWDKPTFQPFDIDNLRKAIAAAMNASTIWNKSK